MNAKRNAKNLERTGDVTQLVNDTTEEKSRTTSHLNDNDSGELRTSTHKRRHDLEAGVRIV